MPNTFEILAGFLDRFDADVEGRERQEPPLEIQSRLRNFAKGTAAESERPELLVLLSENPGWVVWLADEIRALRAGSDSKE